jgi:hypothetical protein
VFEKFKRLCWFALGHSFLALGIIGVFLPVLPTVPFIVIASACYAKVSPKFHQRLRTHRWFGKAVRDWEDTRAISLRSKLIAFASLTISLIFTAYMLSVLWVKWSVFAITLLAALFIATRPTAK